MTRKMTLVDSATPAPCLQCFLVRVARGGYHELGVMVWGLIPATFRVAT